jgi:hypothetical protein
MQRAASASLNIFMAQCLIKLRDKFVFTDNLRERRLYSVNIIPPLIPGFKIKYSM